MIRPTKALALAALVLAGALGATAAQASAANFTVNFKIQNADASAGMSRSSSLPATVAGLGSGTILAGAYDPGSGYATYSDTLPTSGNPAHADITYANSSDGISNPCTFTMTVKRDGNLTQPYLLQFSNHNTARCVVPGDARSSDGTFAGVFTLSWKT